MALRLLIVDDDPAILDLHTLLLRREGHTVVTATHAALAREAARQQPFDVCLVDMLLPDGKGSELARELARAQPETRIVVLSAFRALVPTDLVREAHIAAVLQKPLRQGQLAKAVLDAMGPRAAEPAREEKAREAPTRVAGGRWRLG